MARTLEDKLSRLSPARRKRVGARTAELIAEEQSLRDLRHALALTQEHMAEELGIGQDGISRLEKRSDLLLSTLRSYIEAMGGKLRLVAEFPNRPPVLLGGLQEMAASRAPRRPRSAA
jgi:DNA-binding XRE family transcriptional regulator